MDVSSLQAKEGSGQIDNKTLQRLADAAVADGSALDCELAKPSGHMVKVLVSPETDLTPELQQQVLAISLSTLLTSFRTFSLSLSILSQSYLTRCDSGKSEILEVRVKHVCLLQWEGGLAGRVLNAAALSAALPSIGLQSAQSLMEVAWQQ